MNSKGNQQEKRNDRASESEIYQRHADHYIGILMALDPEIEKDRQELYLEMDQIATAFGRLKSEEVGSNVHPGVVEIRFKEASGGFAQTYLPKLLDGSYTETDLSSLEVAVNLVKSGRVDYPVEAPYLSEKLNDARNKFFKPKSS